MDRRREVEWPTLGLLAACYLVWLLATTWAAALWLPLGMALLALAVTLHSSLQHEVLHGHPFRSRRGNEATVFLPIGLFYPYRRFRDLHLAHHDDERLTDPYDDRNRTSSTRRSGDGCRAGTSGSCASTTRSWGGWRSAP